MSYNSISAIAYDNDLRNRFVACAAVEGYDNPWGWVDAHIWDYAAQPGWGDAYASALAANNPRPGYDEAVITDAMILASTQAIHAADQPGPPNP